MQEEEIIYFISKETNMGAFSDLIYDKRVSQRKTLLEVADQLGISAMYLSELENGKKLPVNSKVIPKLAEYYGLNMDNLNVLIAEERKQMIANEVKNEEYSKLFSAARKNKQISDALIELLKGAK